MTQGLKIAAGYNVSLGSLVDIATISVSGQKFTDPKVIYYYSPGEQMIRADGSVYNNGYPVIDWHFGFMFFPQLPYAQTTWASSGWSGPVTILTPLADITSYQRMNAVLVIPQPAQLKSHLGWFQDVPFKFIRLVPSS